MTNFAEECRRQCLLASEADANDADLDSLMDEPLADLEDQTLPAICTTGEIQASIDDPRPSIPHD